MAIFVCWSGEVSKRFAEETRSFLEKVMLGIEFFLSSDIEKGSLWFDELTANLQKARAGVVCLTSQNLSSPWMHFEIGALFSRRTQKRVFVYSLGAESIDIKGPFGHFQSSLSTKEETTKMISSITKLYKNIEHDWKIKFESEWPSFEQKIRDIWHPSINDVIPEFGNYLNSKTFFQPIKRCLDQNWLDRYSRAKQTLDELNKARLAVEKYLPPEQVSAFQTLISEIDAYLRDLRLIVRNREFKVEGEQVDFANPKDGGDSVSWISDDSAKHQNEIQKLTLQLKQA